MPAVVVVMVLPFWLSVTGSAADATDPGVTLPETCHVWAAAVNPGTVTGPPATVTGWEGGLKLTPARLGVIVYVPLATLGKV